MYYGFNIRCLFLLFYFIGEEVACDYVSGLGFRFRFFGIRVSVFFFILFIVCSVIKRSVRRSWLNEELFVY